MTAAEMEISEVQRRTAEKVAAAPRSAPHVLFILDQLREPFGGAENALVELVRGLPRHGFRCSVLSFAGDQGLPQAPQFACPVRIWPLERTWGLAALRAAMRLRRLLHEEDVQIVHTMFETSDVWAAPLCKLFSRARLVSSRRDMGIQRGRKHKIAYRLFRRVPDRVLTVSEEVRKFSIAADGLRAEGVTTIHNGVAFGSAPTAGATDVKRALGLAPENRIVLSLGNVRRVKGYETLIRAAVIVSKVVPEVRFVIAGSEPDAAHSAELRELLRNLGLEQTVIFAGYREPYGLLRASEVFALPSSSEGFSNALLQAMAAGVPAVATNVGGNGEAIIDGKSGYLVPAGDAEDLAEKLLALLANREHAATMTREAQARYQKFFTVEAMVEQHAHIYRELLERRG